MPIDVANKAPGDDLFAREVNAMTRAIDGLMGTKGPNTIVDSSGVHQRKTPPPSAGSIISVFQYQSNGTDHIICKSFANGVLGTEDIKVGLPFLLRRTPFDGQTIDGLTYTYSGLGSILRTVTDGDITEGQRIVPLYTIGDIIYAAKFSDYELTVSGEQLIWQELNVDARQWARFT